MLYGKASLFGSIEMLVWFFQSPVAEYGAWLDDGISEEGMWPRGDKMSTDAHGTRRFAKESDSRGVTPKVRYVLFNPFKSQSLVPQTHVSWNLQIDIVHVEI